MRERATLLALVAIGLLAAAALWSTGPRRRGGPRETGPREEQEMMPGAQPSGRIGAGQLVLEGGGASPVEELERWSAEAEGGRKARPTGLTYSGPPLPVSALIGLAGSYTPTDEGLLEMTTGQWSQEDFLTMDSDRARSLLPVPDWDGYDPTYPDSLLVLVGRLPTIEDCRFARRYPTVRVAHAVACAWDVAVSDLEMTPTALRTAHLEEQLRSYREARDQAVDNLFRLCDDVQNGYKHWSLCARLFRRWEDAGR